MADDVNISTDAAQVYEKEFVPAIFAQWAPQLVAAARLNSNDRILDAGCGTGVVARAAAALAGHHSLVTGVDINESMLAVARDLSPGISWRRGDLVSLPFADESFDVVLCQFVLMFVPDRIAALREMWRVLAPAGRLVVAVWSDSPVYQALAQHCRREGIDQVADSFEAFFQLSDTAEIEKLTRDAGVNNPTITTCDGVVQFASTDDFVRVEISGWILGDSLDENDYARLKSRAEHEVTKYRDNNGAICFPMNAHLLTATKMSQQANR